MTYHLTVSSVFRNQNANTEAHGWMSRKIRAERFTNSNQDCTVRQWSATKWM